MVVHETPLSVTSQTEPVVQKALSIKVNSSLDETKVNCGHHNLAACRELLNESKKLTCLCTSQKDIDLLFEELYKLKENIAENITTEYGTLLRPDNNSDTWIRARINSPRICALPLCQKRKMAKQVGVKYDIYKAASNISARSKKESDECIFEILTSHSIDNNFEIYTVPNHSIEVEIEEELLSLTQKRMVIISKVLFSIFNI